MSIAGLALVLQFATTLPLVGLIWLVQIVSYPLFARVGATGFAAYHEAHSRLITFVVGPLMVGELTGAIAGAFFVNDVLPRGVAWLGAGLAVAAWLLTLFVAVPNHLILADGFDIRAHGRLVATNWLRTGVWTLRGLILLWAVARAIVPTHAVLRAALLVFALTLGNAPVSAATDAGLSVAARAMPPVLG